MTRPGASSAGSADHAASRIASTWWCALAVMVPMAVVAAGLLSGARTLFFRDIFNLHLPAKLAQAAAWRDGLLPLVDTFRAGGQPSLGNLNTLPLYPDNVLYLLSDALWALNAHFWLHLLLAPLSAFWMGRTFGLSRVASWAVAATYSFSGSFLSQAGFYNLVPAAALAPALVAAVLQTSRRPWTVSPGAADPSAAGAAPGRSVRSTIALAALWCLLLLGGDPILATQALGVAGLAVLFDTSSGGPRGFAVVASRRIARLVPGLVAGTLLALPQLIGLMQTLGFSYRGYIGYVEESTLVASWDPRQVLEWLLPLCFGSPRLGFWGEAFSGGQLPLFFSVHPGLVAVALVLAAGLPRDAAARWGATAAAGGLFLALGAWNPVVRGLARLPGADLLRFPVKFYLAVGLGSAVLAGIGLERALRGGGRHLLRACGVVLLLLLLLFAVLLQMPDRVESWLEVAGSLSSAQAAAVRANWTLGAGVQSALALALAALALAIHRRRGVAVVLLLALHTVTQLLWLRTALLPTDEASAYRGKPPLLEYLEPGETLVHGGYGDVFGPARASGLPDNRLLWVQRRGFLELYPFAGVRFGREYELNVSAEGLDSFLTDLTFKVMRDLDDGQRLRALRALGVEALVLDRALEPPLAEGVSLRAEVASLGGRAYLYSLEAVPDLVVAGTVYRSPDVNRNISAVIDPRFDPYTMAVIPGQGPALHGPPGSVLELHVDEAERLEARVLAHSPSVLVAQRAYLPLYRAEVDGRPAKLTVANFDRIALELPGGVHQVRIWTDRRPLRWSWLGVAAGALYLAWLLVRARTTGVVPGPPRQVSVDTGE